MVEGNTFLPRNNDMKHIVYYFRFVNKKIWPGTHHLYVIIDFMFTAPYLRIKVAHYLCVVLIVDSTVYTVVLQGITYR